MRILRLLLLISMFCGTLLTGASSAAGQVDATKYTSEKTGRIIDIGDSGDARYDLDNTYTEEDGGFYYENIAVERGSSLIYIVLTNEPSTPQQWESQSHAIAAPDYQAYEILDEQVLTHQYSSVVRVTTRLQFTEIVYSEFQRFWIDGDPLILTVFSTEDRLVDDLHWTRDNVTVDGESVTMHTDYSHLQTVLDGTSGVEPRIFTDHITTVADWEDLGLVSENEWVSPQFGVTLTWEQQWELRFPKRDAIYTEAGGLDGVSLATAELDGEVFVSLAAPTAERSTPEDWLARWTSDKFLDLVGGAQSYTLLDSELTDDTASVILLATTWQGEEFITVYDAYVPDDGPTIIRRTNATSENIVAIMTLTWDGLSADGERIPHSWTIEEIEAIFTT